MAKQGKEKGKFAKFLEKQDIRISAKRYFIDGMSAMAQGLFASLLVGTILKTLGSQLNIAFLVTIGAYAMEVVGPAMGVAIGRALKAPSYVLLSLAAVGYIANKEGGAGGPLAVFFVALVACECGKLVSGVTPIDLLVTPIVTIVVGGGLSLLVAPYIGIGANAVGQAIMWATDLQPFLMGMLVSLIVGVALTLPISSAAICSGLGLVGLAGGAALAGCCANMVGFAVASFRENKWGGLVAQGLGTSMLQMGNIIHNPRIWIPALVASLVNGPVATCLFRLQMNGPAISSGMGTCGLVGQIGVYTGWMDDVAAGLKVSVSAVDWIGLIVVSIVIPAVVSWLVSVLLRKAGWIKEGDMALKAG